MSKGFGIRKAKKKLNPVVPVMPEYQENFDRFIQAVRSRNSGEFYVCFNFLLDLMIDPKLHIQEVCMVLGAVTRGMSLSMEESYRLWTKEECDKALKKAAGDLAAFQAEINLELSNHSVQ